METNRIEELEEDYEVFVEKMTDLYPDIQR